MVVNKHRWLVAIGSYIAITTALQIIASIVIAIGVATGMRGWFARFMLSFPTYGQVQLIVLASAIICIALFAAFYFTTRYMLNKRLNLQ